MGLNSGGEKRGIHSEDTLIFFYGGGGGGGGGGERGGELNLGRGKLVLSSLPPSVSKHWLAYTMPKKGDLLTFTI